MNWNHFLLLLIGIYLGYYAVNILTDLYLKQTAPGGETDQDVLFFSEDSQPEIIVYDDNPEPLVTKNQELQPASPEPDAQKSYPIPPLVSTGAVSLKELNKVALAGLLQYTKAIPY